MMYEFVADVEVLGQKCELGISEDHTIVDLDSIPCGGTWRVEQQVLFSDDRLRLIITTENQVVGARPGFDGWAEEITEEFTWHCAVSEDELLEELFEIKQTSDIVSQVVAKEYDRSTSACLIARYEDLFDEPLARVFFDGENRYFTTGSGDCFLQERGKMPKMISMAD